MDKSDEYLSLSLDAITSYIRGNINLDEATDILITLGHNSKSARKVLKNTERNNIIKLKPKKKQKNKNKIKSQNNIIKLNPKKSNELIGLKGPDDDFYIDMEIEDFIALNEEDDEEYYFEIDFEN